MLVVLAPCGNDQPEVPARTTDFVVLACASGEHFDNLENLGWQITKVFCLNE